MKIFLAGAAGAVGRRLVPLLLEAGHDVFGTTRSTTKAHALRAAGVEPIIVDVFDAPALSGAITAARPDVVVHQLTDLPPGLDPGWLKGRGATPACVARERGILLQARLQREHIGSSRKASPGCTHRGRSRTGRTTHSICTRLARAR